MVRGHIMISCYTIVELHQGLIDIIFVWFRAIVNLLSADLRLYHLNAVSSIVCNQTYRTWAEVQAVSYRSEVLWFLCVCCGVRGATVHLSRCTVYLSVCLSIAEVNWLESIWTQFDVVFGFVCVVCVCVCCLGDYVLAHVLRGCWGVLRFSFCCLGICFNHMQGSFACHS